MSVSMPSSTSTFKKIIFIRSQSTNIFPCHCIIEYYDITQYDKYISQLLTLCITLIQCYLDASSQYTNLCDSSYFVKSGMWSVESGIVDKRSLFQLSTFNFQLLHKVECGVWKVELWIKDPYFNFQLSTFNFFSCYRS